MLTIFKTTPEGLETIQSIVNGCWISAIDPHPEEIAQLEEWGVEPELITYSLDLDEMARVERDEGYTLILLRIPYLQGENQDIPYITIPMGIIIKDNFIATICRHPNDISRILTNGKYRGFKTAKRYRFVLYVLLETATRYLAHLRDINRAVDNVEDQLQKSTRNRELLELLKYQKCLVYFTTALRSNEVMMERLQRMKMFNQYEEDEDLLEDVLTENQQAIQTTNIQTEILSSMMDAFASIISNNLNVVMKALAALTIILNLPTIVASFYGMNVALPGEEHPLAFLTVFGIAIGMTAIATYIFYKRDWF
ncbi:MAG: magnesium transporter CorA family protein [Chloroflexota bacterium]